MRIPARLVRKWLRCDRGIAALEFAVLAPALLMLVFSIFVYSIYFAALGGVREAAAEGARAAVAGLTPAERQSLATTRAGEVVANYASVLGGGSSVTISATPSGAGQFTVAVSYDMSASPIMTYGGFLPLPSSTVSGSATVNNGSY